MNLTCSYCQTPFTLGMAEKVAALQRMQAENMHHYDARCPRCGRANAVSRERLEMFTPGWQEAIKETASESAPVSSTEPTAPEPMPSGPAPVMPAKAQIKPAVKKPVKPEAKKPAKPAKEAVPAKAKPKKAVKKTAAKKTKRKK
jgi:hypothetical protein